MENLTKAGRPASYRKQEACATCAHVFVQYEHDGWQAHYCHRDGTQRPPCGSVAMPGERFVDDFTIGEKERERAFREFHRRWDRWAWTREVVSYGICDAYVRKEQ